MNDWARSILSYITILMAKSQKQINKVCIINRNVNHEIRSSSVFNPGIL